MVLGSLAEQPPCQVINEGSAYDGFLSLGADNDWIAHRSGCFEKVIFIRGANSDEFTCIRKYCRTLTHNVWLTKANKGRKSSTKNYDIRQNCRCGAVSVRPSSPKALASRRSLNWRMYSTGYQAFLAEEKKKGRSLWYRCLKHYRKRGYYGKIGVDLPREKARVGHELLTTFPRLRNAPAGDIVRGILNDEQKKT